MTSKNNRARICHFKLSASFRSHLWIQTGVTVRKRSIRVKIVDFSVRVTFKFDERPRKSIGHLFYVTSSFVLVVICGFNMEMPKLGQNLLWPLLPWPLTSDLDSSVWITRLSMWLLLKISWWYDDGNFVKNVWRTDGQERSRGCLVAAKNGEITGRRKLA